MKVLIYSLLHLFLVLSAFAQPQVVNVRGDFANDSLGNDGLFSPGDLNGDNIPDLVTLSSLANSSAGASNNLGIIKAINGATGAVLYDVKGEFAGDFLGSGGLFLPGDLNADNIPDLVAVSGLADSAPGVGFNSGIVKVIDGATGAVLYDVYGDFASDGLGNDGLFLPGDLDGDNIPDLVAVSADADSVAGAGDNVGIVKAINGATGEVLYDVYGDFDNDGLGNNGLFLPGDLDGDNIPDLVAVSANADFATRAISDAGIVRIINGATGAILHDVYGDFANDSLGSGEFAADGLFLPGDLSGDNIPDLVAVSTIANSATGAVVDTGIVKAINGATGAVIYDVHGDFRSDRLGNDGLFLPGDLNGDNIPDLVSVSVIGDSAAGTNDNVGIVKVINGATGAVLYDVRGDFDSDLLGSGGLFLPGDLSGDNIPDLVAVSDFADSATGAVVDTGIVRVINGATGAVIYDIHGDFRSDRLGDDGLFLPGDLSGDNVPDLVAVSSIADTATGAFDNRGVVKVINGATGAVLYDVRGEFAAESLGNNGLFLPGDLNGDSIPDLVAVSGVADSTAETNNNLGIVKVISGATGAVLYDVYGDFASDSLGSDGLFLPGDISGDNIPDLVAVSDLADSAAGTNDNVGIVKAINGATGAVLYNVRGDFANDRLGINQLFFSGDLNSDNIPDIATVSSIADSAAGADDNVGIVKIIYSEDLDLCPTDDDKTAPGVCGCGRADDDTDMDGQLDCQETCPMDANKTAPGICGCGTADTDTDSDDTADCNDMCPTDAAKVMPEACGCGTADTDDDNNEIADCRDEEPAFDLSEKVLKRINRITVNTPKRRLFGANKLINLVKRLDNPEIELLARRLKAVARRIRRSQNNGSLTSRELARFKRITQRRITRLQAALQAADDS